MLKKYLKVLSLAPLLLLNACDDNSSGSGSNNSGFDDGLMSMAPAIDSSDDLYVGGRFMTYNGQPLHNIMRFNSDGSLDTGFDSKDFNDGVIGIVYTIAPTPDKTGVYVGGSFTSYNGRSIGNIARLNNDGSLDTSFDTSNGFNETVYSIVPAKNGKLYVGGSFTSYKGVTRQYIARLNNDGSLDTSFDTSNGFNDEVNSIVPATDSSGDVYVGGWFTSYKGVTRQRIARLNNNGSLDTGFDSSSGFDDSQTYTMVENIVPAHDLSGDVGDVYVSGTFERYKGVARQNIARLNSDGSLDTSFDSSTGFNDGANHMSPATDSSGIYVSGDFTTYKGTPVGHIARLNSNGSLDTTFVSGLDSSIVWTFASATDGSNDVFVGGLQDTISNSNRSGLFARLSATGSLK